MRTRALTDEEAIDTTSGGVETKIEDIERIEQYAKENNLEVKIAGPGQLFLDIDEPFDDIRITEKQRAIIEILQQIKDIGTLWNVTKISKSRSGNKHLVIDTGSDLDLRDVIILQLLLGSDPKREAHNYVRHLRGDKRPMSVLFEVKNANNETTFKRE